MGGNNAVVVFLFCRAAAKIEIRVLDQIRSLVEDGQE